MYVCTYVYMYKGETAYTHMYMYICVCMHTVRRNGLDVTAFQASETGLSTGAFCDPEFPYAIPKKKQKKEPVGCQQINGRE